MNAVHIALDTYDDIFSDFDPSPYHERALSTDFLIEMKKRGIEKHNDQIEIRFSLPNMYRDLKLETLIKKRLRTYFSKKAEDELKKAKKEYMNAAKKTFVGFMFLFFEMITEYYSIEDLWVRLISIPMIPAGWYLLYSSFETIVDHNHIHLGKIKYLQKISKASFQFISEEDVLKVLSENQETRQGEQPANNKNTS